MALQAKATPIGEYEPTVPVEEGLRRIVPERSGVSIGPALLDVGQQVGALNQHIQQQDAAAFVGPALAQLRVAGEQHLLSNASKPQADIDKSGGFTPAVMDDFGRSVTDSLKGSPNPLATRMLKEGVANIGSDLQMRALRQDAVGRMTQVATGALDAANHVATAVELNPNSWQAAGAEQLHMVQGLGLDTETTTKLSHEIDTTISQAAGRGYAKQDPVGTLGRLNDPNDQLFSGMDLQTRNGLTQYARAQLVSQKASGIVDQYRTVGAQAGIQALGTIDKDASIPADLRDEVRSQVNSGVNQLRDDSRQKHVQEITALQENVAKGTAGAADRSQAWALYRQNALDPSQLAGTLDSIDRSELKQAQSGVSQAVITDAYANHTPLDPKDKDVQGAVGDFFTGLTRGVAPGSPEYTNRAADIALRTGVVPDPAVSWARANLTSGNAQSAAQAANLIARIDEANPRAMGFGVDDKTKAMADSISRAVTAGTAPDVAVNLARQNATLSKDGTQALDERWRAATTGTVDKTSQSQSSALTSILGNDAAFKPGMFSSVPKVPPAMQGEFDDLSKRYFDLTGGNLGQARQLAAQDIKRTWGVSQVNGSREIMPYAPEVMFPGLNAQVVRDDIQKAVSESPAAFQRMNPATGQLESAKPSADSIRIVPTDRTARTNGLEWQLAAPDEFGAMDVLRGKDGNPLTYRLPVNRTDFDAVRDRQAQASIAKARQLQKDHEAAAALHDVESRAGFDDEGMR